MNFCRQTFIRSVTIVCILLLGRLACLGNEIIFSRLSVNDGLRSNFVNCVWQDQKGFIWVGTESGLQRYDGSRFIQVYGQTDRSLPILPVQQIVGDHQHNMWLNLGRIIGRFDLKTNRFIKADMTGLPDADPTLYVDSHGNVLMTLKEFGIYKYDLKKNKFELWKELKVPDNWGVLTFFEDTLTGRYLISGTAGLGVYDPKHHAFYTEADNPLQLPILNLKLGASIVRVFIDSHRRYWVLKWLPALAPQFFCYNEKSGELSIKDTYSDVYGYCEILNIDEINGKLFISGDNIFNMLNEDTGKFYKFYDRANSYGIKFNLIRQLYGDADHNIWVANDNGLYMAANTRGRIRHGQLPIINTDVTDIKQISNGQLVIATWGSGIFPFNVYNKDLSLTLDSVLKKQVHSKSPTVENYLSTWCVAEHSVTHHLYVGCQAGILIDHDPLTKHSTFITDQQIFKNSTIRCITEDRQHNLWFGSQSGKLIEKTAAGKYEFVTNLNWRIGKITVDERGNLWLFTAGDGILIFDPVQKKVIQRYGVSKDASKSLSNLFIKDAVRINDSLYAIACSVNLDILNIRTGKVKKLTVYDGLPMPVINCLVTDKSGQLWMATNGGIVRYDLKENIFHVYDQKDGLITTTDNKNLLYTATCLKTGELAFAGGNTYIVFDPEALHEQKRPRDVTITDIRLFNTYINPDSVLATGKLKLAHDQNAITLQFASLSYTQRNKLTYYYRLDGGGKDWIRSERSLSASYASLAPGQYTFMVKCVSPEGLASAHVTTLAIDIVPAFWQTWWFVVLLLILGAIPLYIIYRLRINRLLAVQKVRERVARDLHDDMGSTLTSIGILSEMANVKMTGDNAVSKDYLNRISANSSQMMDAMDDIVWSINPANDSMDRIIARMREYAATVLEPRNIDYTLLNDDKLNNIKLDMEVRRNLVLIFKETLNNLVKYSRATVVQIEFAVNNSKLQLTVTDNGVGFDKQTVVYGNGITNMRKRAEGMHGSFTISSEKNKGAVAVLQIPIT